MIKRKKYFLATDKRINSYIVGCKYKMYKTAEDLRAELIVT